MKKIVERAREISRTVAVNIRRAVDPPLDERATPLDIRHAVLEAVERRVQPAGHGRRIMPDACIRVKVHAPDAAGERALRTALDDVQRAAQMRLRELTCELPAGFQVDVVYVRSRPASWDAGQRIAVDYPAAGRPAAAAPDDVAPVPQLRIAVLAGMATKPIYVFTDTVVRVGRSEAPVDGRGRVRRNDVVFVENDDERNRTVTRGHAEIRYSRQAGEYRVFDEGSANGTRILRGGEAIDVPSRDPVGLALRSGDELQFGKACVKVTYGSRSALRP